MMDIKIFTLILKTTDIIKKIEKNLFLDIIGKELKYDILDKDGMDYYRIEFEDKWLIDAEDGVSGLWKFKIDRCAS
jgi:hypothetical protein